MEVISKCKYWFIALALSLAGVGGYFLYTRKSVVKKGVTQGNAPYYSKATYDMIASGTLSGAILAKFGEKPTSNIKPWRILSDDEFSSVYGTLSWTFGYDMKNPPKGKAGFNSVAQWCKAMNLDIVSLQGYLCLFLGDITTFSQKAKQYSYPFSQVKIGEAYA